MPLLQNPRSVFARGFLILGSPFYFTGVAMAVPKIAALNPVDGEYMFGSRDDVLSATGQELIHKAKGDRVWA